MDQLVQIQPNFPQFLRDNQQALEEYPNSPLKKFYSHPEIEAVVNIVYKEAAIRTVPRTAAVGGLIGSTVAAVYLGSGFCVPITIGYITKAALIRILGISLGAGIGFVYETKKLAVEIRQHPIYTNWKKSIEQPILDRYKEVLKSDTFQDLRCSISHDIPRIAVRDTHNKLYDQEAILKWIDEHGTNPFVQQPLRRSDLTFDVEFAGNLMRASQLVFGDPDIVLRGQENKAEIVKGLKAALESCIENHNMIVLATADRAKQAAIAHGRSPVEVQEIYQRHMAAFIDRPAIAEPRLSGMNAIVTSESPEELGANLVREAPGIIRRVLVEIENDFPVIIRGAAH